MLSPEVWEKKFLPKPNHPYPSPPPLKCQMVGPLVRNKPGIKPVENGPPEELTLEIITLNSRRSIYLNSIITPRLCGHFSTFGLVVFVLKSLLRIARKWSRENFAISTLKPRIHVRILIYRTWAKQRFKNIFRYNANTIHKES